MLIFISIETETTTQKHHHYYLQYHRNLIEKIMRFAYYLQYFLP